MSKFGSLGSSCSDHDGLQVAPRPLVSSVDQCMNVGVDLHPGKLPDTAPQSYICRLVHSPEFPAFPSLRSPRKDIFEACGDYLGGSASTPSVADHQNSDLPVKS